MGLWWPLGFRFEDGSNGGVKREAVVVVMLMNRGRGRSPEIELSQQVLFEGWSPQDKGFLPLFCVSSPCSL